MNIRNFTYLNSILFLIFSSVAYFFEISKPFLILMPNICYAVLGILIFLNLQKEIERLLPYTWYLAGTILYFGFGPLFLYANDKRYSIIHFGEDLKFINKINLINSISILIITIIVSLFNKKKIELIGYKENDESKLTITKKYKAISYVSIIIILTIKFITFPIVESLFLRSIIDKVLLVYPSFFLILGICYYWMEKKDKIKICILILMQVIYGLLALNKTEILMPIFALLIGGGIARGEIKKTIIGGILLIIAFMTLNSVISTARLSIYTNNENKIIDRIYIIKETILATINKKVDFNVKQNDVVLKNNDSPLNLNEKTKLNTILRDASVRFELIGIEGFLINEHDAGRRGQSFDDFFRVLIPRIFYEDKPIITRFGPQLNYIYHGKDVNQMGSSMAPTYAGEAYWNSGFLGVIAISIYLGVCLGIFTIIALVKYEPNIPYLLISYPLLHSTFFIESWVVPSYVGGYCILLIVYGFLSYTMTMGKLFKN